MKRAATIIIALLAAACGGSSPTGVTPSPSPTPVGPVHDVTVVVFYDENGNGAVDGTEAVRLGGTEVEIAGRTARSEARTGRAVVKGVPDGRQAVTVRAATLPPFYAPGSPAAVDVPQAADGEAPVALTLPIGQNKANRYMAFGDSITVGDGSQDGSGYRRLLEDRLRDTLGAAQIVNEGVRGTQSNSGAERIRETLAVKRPAFTLILYGTNDWNAFECKQNPPCFTVDSLRAMVQRTKGAGSLPVLATIPPANPAYPVQSPPARNDWVATVDDLIRPMAQEEGALLVDLHAALLKQGDLTQLFTDHVHPNDRGYAIIADEFFKALTTPPSGGSASVLADLPSFSFTGSRRGRAWGSTTGPRPDEPRRPAGTR